MDKSDAEVLKRFPKTAQMPSRLRGQHISSPQQAWPWSLPLKL